jgi:hypothetical protein
LITKLRLDIAKPGLGSANFRLKTTWAATNRVGEQVQYNWRSAEHHKTRGVFSPFLRTGAWRKTRMP